MASVVLEGVGKVFPGGVRALDRLDLEALDRELLVLVGPSGCGKSTTLRLIAGLDEPTEGSIRIGSREVRGIAPRHRNTAMVFQNCALYPHLSARRNMAFSLELRRGGWLRRLCRRTAKPTEAVFAADGRQSMAEQVRQTARLLEIEHLLDRMPWELSGGEQRRVALGKAMVRRPAVFLLDEPLANLDAATRVRMQSELRRLHRSLDVTMIYVTHDQVEALTLGDRVVVMRFGRAVQIGSPREVLDRPRNRFVAGFLGSPAMNFIRGQIDNAGGNLRFVGGGVTAEPQADAPERLQRFGDRGFGDRDVVLGVRPSDVIVGGGAIPGERGACLAEVSSIESRHLHESAGCINVPGAVQFHEWRPGQLQRLLAGPRAVDVQLH